MARPLTREIKKYSSRLSQAKFDEAYLVLGQYCDLLDIKLGTSIKYKGLLDYAIRGKRAKITYNPNSSKEEVIAIILHELGHYRADIRNGYNPTVFEAIDKALGKRVLSAEEVKVLVDCEQEAWNEAVYIANELNIKLGKWFEDFKDSCLRSYFNLIK